MFVVVLLTADVSRVEASSAAVINKSMIDTPRRMIVMLITNAMLVRRACRIVYVLLYH